MTPVRSVTASRAPRIRAAHASSPLRTPAAASGTSAYTNANLSWSFADPSEALTHQCDCLDRGSRAVPPGSREHTAPRSGTTDPRRGAPTWPDRAGVPPASASPVARASTAIPLSALPVPDGIASARNRSMLCVNRVRAASSLPSACSTCPDTCSACATVSMSPTLWARAMARSSGGPCPRELSLRPPHAGGAEQRFRLGGGRKRGQASEICSYHRRPSAACPRITQKYFSPQAMSVASAARPRSMSHASVAR